MAILGRNPAVDSLEEGGLPELRRARREDITVGVSTFAELSDGTVLEGAVRDISDNGARIAGQVEDLECGQSVRIVFVVQSDQKVYYDCEVRYIQHEGGFYGVEFKSGPHPLDPEYQSVGREPVQPDAIKQGCRLCGGTFELGYVADHLHQAGGRESLVQTRWVAGRPSRAAYSSYRTQNPSGRLRVDVYRCTGCGHLEHYAVAAPPELRT